MFHLRWIYASGGGGGMEQSDLGSDAIIQLLSMDVWIGARECAKWRDEGQLSKF